ncbi:MAG: YaiI/YqxD family protein [Methylomonas sp.]|nr:YaiI/YqxD family protein [Methylomonas sp.]
MSPTIWVDGDACPNTIKTVLFRAAEKRRLKLWLIANHTVATPPSKFIRAIRVSGGFDVADDYIVKHLEVGDLVITGDIPLASRVIALGGFVINPRGESYTLENIGEKLAMRDFLDDMRNNGLITGGPAAMSAKDVQSFANALDRFLVSRRI